VPSYASRREKHATARLHEDETSVTARFGADAEDAPAEYTLRRSCAQALDCLAVELSSDLLHFVLPLVQRFLGDSDWRRREAAILALGAIADGCMDGLRPHAHAVLQLLIAKTRDGQPNVRCNACWAVGRYAAFAVEAAAESSEGGGGEAGAALLELLAALVERTHVRLSLMSVAFSLKMVAWCACVPQATQRSSCSPRSSSARMFVLLVLERCWVSALRA
jgi:HEAT repeat protein